MNEPDHVLWSVTSEVAGPHFLIFGYRWAITDFTKGTKSVWFPESLRDRGWTLTKRGATRRAKRRSDEIAAILDEISR